MTSVEFTDQSQFDALKRRMEADLGRELNETEISDILLEFGVDNYDKIITKLRVKLDDKSPTQEQIDYLLSHIIKDAEVTDASENIDEIVYGV